MKLFTLPRFVWWTLGVMGCMDLSLNIWAYICLSVRHLDTIVSSIILIVAATYKLHADESR
jgi:hypothetical protein